MLQEIPRWEAQIDGVPMSEYRITHALARDERLRAADDDHALTLFRNRAAKYSSAYAFHHLVAQRRGPGGEKRHVLADSDANGKVVSR